MRAAHCLKQSIFWSFQMRNGYPSNQTQERQQTSNLRTPPTLNVFAEIDKLLSKSRQQPLANNECSAQHEGTALLNDIETVLRRFSWLPNERDYTILPLWIVYDH